MRAKQSLPFGRPAREAGPGAQSIAGTRVWIAPVFACCMLLAGALPLILAGHNHGRGAYDQNNFHLLAIRDFARQWPHFDFSDYSSATTPGYHLVLAAADRFMSDDLRFLRLVGAIFSIGLIGMLAMAVAPRSGTTAAILLCLPCICSPYIFSSCVWLLPDNAGWWGVLAILLITLRPTVDRWTYLLGGFVLLILVIVRQGHLWTAAPLCTTAWIGGERGSTHSVGSAPRAVNFQLGESVRDADPTQVALVKLNRWRRLVGMMIAIAPAVGAIVWFAIVWHGMTPPNQRGIVEGINPAAPAMALAVAGALGVFFVPLLWTRIQANQLPIIALVGAIVGGIIGVLPETTYSLARGRFSGIWNAVPHFGYICNRSPMMVGLSMLGGAVLAIWFSRMPLRHRWIWGSAVIAFGATQVMTHSAFQRYDEPLVLIAAALSAGSLEDKPPRWVWSGPVFLAVILGGITVMSLK